MRGFTLIELLVVVLIFSIVLVGTFAVLTIGKRSWQLGFRQAQAQQEARRAMDYMIKELRGASSIDQSTFAGGVSSDIIRFTLDGETVQVAKNEQAQLIRTPSGITPVLANNIESVQFYLIGGDMVYITLTTQSEIMPGSTVLNSQVLLRN